MRVTFLSTALLLALGLTACGRHATGGDFALPDLGSADAGMHGDGGRVDGGGGVDGGGVDGGGRVDGGGCPDGCPIGATCGTDGLCHTTGVDGGAQDGGGTACAMLAMCCERLTIPEFRDGCFITVEGGNESACAELATSPMYCPPAT